MPEHFRLEPVDDHGVATLRLDRPKVNALDEIALRELTEVCDELEGRSDVRAVVLWGGPRVFGGGADIEPMLGFSPDDAAAFSRLLNDAVLCVERLPQVTISAVNGYALGGGCELALATDFRVAADNAFFGLPEIQLGIFPGGGGTQRLTRLIGVTPAKQLIYTGDRCPADEALRLGLVSAVFPADELHTEAVALARRFARSAAAVHIAKATILDGLHLPLDEAVALESERFGEAFATNDATIGLESFVANGPGRADFTGT